MEPALDAQCCSSGCETALQCYTSIHAHKYVMSSFYHDRESSFVKFLSWVDVFAHRQHLSQVFHAPAAPSPPYWRRQLLQVLKSPEDLVQKRLQWSCYNWGGLTPIFLCSPDAHTFCLSVGEAHLKGPESCIEDVVLGRLLHIYFWFWICVKYIKETATEIEYCKWALWNELEHWLWVRPHHHTLVLDLINALVAEWERIPAARCQNLVETLKRRVEAVIAD